MAIQIRQQLTATPNPTALPSQVDFRQTLRSSQDGESITLEYRLAADHDVWFKGDDGQPTKSVRRSATIPLTDTVRLDQLVLQVRPPGLGPMDMVEIDQTITDAAGIRIPDSCVLRLLH
ncbi:MAG TPA: hypothetical protein VHR45_16825 [Thermoanaerobaculia bacterium]|nr:hypothetical protein [Thermoanaerobaculia bacterium]